VEGLVEHTSLLWYLNAYPHLTDGSDAKPYFTLTCLNRSWRDREVASLDLLNCTVVSVPPPTHRRLCTRRCGNHHGADEADSL